MIKINFDKYGKIRNLDFGDEVIFKGNNRVNQIFVAFDDVAYNPNHYMTYSALINENDYEGNLTDLATAKTTIDGVEGYTFYLFSNLTAKAGELKLSVRLVDRTSERVLVSGIIPLVIEDTAISTYASVDITKTQYNALLTAFDELSQSIDATNFKTINGESIYGEGDIVVLTGDVMVDYVGQQISDVNDSLWNLSQRISDVENENAELNAIIEKQDKKIKQLELASEGNILSTITESDSAYEVDVSGDTLPYATIDKIGGMTYKSDNLLNLANKQDTYNGVTYKVENGIITLNGTTTTGTSLYLHESVSLQKKFNLNEKFSVAFWFSGTFSNNVELKVSTYNGSAYDVINCDSIKTTETYKTKTFTITKESYLRGVMFYMPSGTTLTNVVIKPMLVKGSTAPSSWQPYFEGLRDSKVTEIINHGANILNLNDIAETTKNGVVYKVKDGIITLNGTNSSSSTTWLEIPVNITLNGNYSINWFQEGTSSAVVYYRFQNKTGTRFLGYQETKENVSINDTMTIISIPVNANATLTNYKLKPMLVKGSTAPTTFKQYHEPTAIAIPTAIQNLDGYGQSNFEDNNEYNYIDFENKKFIRYGYYEGETWKSSYLETDIAEVLQDNVIEVESGGTITFENEYKQDVPFTWTFQEKL